MQIREEEKQIDPNELARCLEINNNEINKLITVGLLPRNANRGKFFPSELFSCLKRWESLPSFQISDEDKQYFDDLISSRLLKYNTGIFVISSDSYSENFNGMSDMIKQYGVWKAQGLNNHVHFVDITTNFVHQILLAGAVIEHWIYETTKMKLSDTCVTYWNGSINSTICIYSLCGVEYNFLGKYDKELGIIKVRQRKTIG